MIFASFCLDEVLRTVVSLFMETAELPLPTLDEVLICNEKTTAEEVRSYQAYYMYHKDNEFAFQVMLLWQLALNDPEGKRIYCLVHAEKLLNHVADEAFRELMYMVMKSTKDTAKSCGKLKPLIVRLI